MKTRKEQIAELNESDRLALKHYEIHPQYNPWNNPDHPVYQLWELGKKIAESLKPKIWEPKGGKYFVNSTGMVFVGSSSDERRLAGIEAENEEKAQRKAALRIEREIINDFICEVNEEIDFVADWDNQEQNKYSITFNHKEKVFVDHIHFRHEPIGHEVTNKKGRKRVLEMLNNNLVRGVRKVES